MRIKQIKHLRINMSYITFAFNSLARVQYNRNITTPTKIRIYKAAVLTVLL